MKNCVDRVLQMEAYVRQDDQESRNGVYRVLERADVVWAVWSDDEETPVVRVIRGRDRDGPDLRHGALKFENEISTLETASYHGDEIGLLADGRTLDVPEPAVPRHLIGHLMSDPVLFCDGTERSSFAPSRPRTPEDRGLRPEGVTVPGGRGAPGRPAPVTARTRVPGADKKPVAVR